MADTPRAAPAVAFGAALASVSSRPAAGGVAIDAGIRFDLRGGLGRAHLDRPAAFNALTADMCIAFRARLAAWRDDARVKAVLVTSAGGRAFCAGGDVRGLYRAMTAGDPAGRAFFRHEYRLDYAVRSFPKPYVAFADGIVMGGGAGISVNGSHCVLTERSLFAMPETGIGLFPDVGATAFLRRCPGEIGMYLALTGARLGPADALYAGIGAHYLPSDRLAALEDALAEALAAAGPPADADADAGAAVGAALAGLAASPGPPGLRAQRGRIDRIFAAGSVAGILDALAADGSDWAQDTAAALRAKSPTSLLATFRQLREGAGLDFAAVLRREYRMACAFLDGHDFREGVRAAVIDKDRAPRWRPARLEDVRPEDVAACFAPPCDGDLDLDRSD